MTPAERFANSGCELYAPDGVWELPHTIARAVIAASGALAGGAVGTIGAPVGVVAGAVLGAVATWYVYGLVERVAIGGRSDRKDVDRDALTVYRSLRGRLPADAGLRELRELRRDCL